MATFGSSDDLQGARFVDVNLQLATVSESVTVTADASQVDTSTNTLGNTVSGREVLDLVRACER